MDTASLRAPQIKSKEPVIFSCIGFLTNKKAPTRGAGKDKT